MRLGEGWGRLGSGFYETIISNKAVPEVLNMKCISEFKLGFTNSGCLHSAILKALHGFKGKRVHKARGMQFSLQNV